MERTSHTYHGRRWMRSSDICARYGDISTRTVSRWVKNGILPQPVYRNGVRYWAEDVLDTHDQEQATNNVGRTVDASSSHRRHDEYFPRTFGSDRACSAVPRHHTTSRTSCTPGSRIEGDVRLIVLGGMPSDLRRSRTGTFAMSDMGRLPFSRRFDAEFLSDIKSLTAAERGVYATLESMMMDSGVPLDLTPRLHRGCGLRSHSQLTAMLDILVAEGLVEFVDGRIWGRRCDREMQWRRSKSLTNSQNAVRNPGKKDNKNNATAKRPQLRQELESESPLPPKGGWEEVGGKIDAVVDDRRPRMKIYPKDPSYDRWVKYYATVGGQDLIDEAQKRGWFEECSKWAPELPPAAKLRAAYISNATAPTASKHGDEKAA